MSILKDRADVVDKLARVKSPSPVTLSGCSRVKTRTSALSSRPEVRNQGLIIMNPPDPGGLLSLENITFFAVKAPCTLQKYKPLWIL